MKAFIFVVLITLFSGCAAFVGVYDEDGMYSTMNRRVQIRPRYSPFYYPSYYYDPYRFYYPYSINAPNVIIIKPNESHNSGVQRHNYSGPRRGSRNK